MPLNGIWARSSSCALATNISQQVLTKTGTCLKQPTAFLLPSASCRHPPPGCSVPWLDPSCAYKTIPLPLHFLFSSISPTSFSGHFSFAFWRASLSQLLLLLILPSILSSTTNNLITMQLQLPTMLVATLLSLVTGVMSAAQDVCEPANEEDCNFGLTGVVWEEVEGSSSHPPPSTILISPRITTLTRLFHRRHGVVGRRLSPRPQLRPHRRAAQRNTRR